MVNKKFRLGMLVMVLVFCLPGIAFAAGSSENMWSTVSGSGDGGFLRIISEDSVMEEILLTFDRGNYNEIRINRTAISRDAFLRNLFNTRTEFMSVGGNTQAIEQEIRWLQNNDLQNFVYSSRYSILAASTIITVVRGSNIFLIEFFTPSRLFPNGNWEDLTDARITSRANLVQHLEQVLMRR